MNTVYYNRYYEIGKSKQTKSLILSMASYHINKAHVFYFSNVTMAIVSDLVKYK